MRERVCACLVVSPCFIIVDYGFLNVFKLSLVVGYCVFLWILLSECVSCVLRSVIYVCYELCDTVVIFNVCWPGSTHTLAFMLFSVFLHLEETCNIVFAKRHIVSKNIFVPVFDPNTPWLLI